MKKLLRRLREWLAKILAPWGEGVSTGKGTKTFMVVVDCGENDGKENAGEAGIHPGD